jgi:hypothetical protein
MLDDSVSPRTTRVTWSRPTRNSVGGACPLIALAALPPNGGRRFYPQRRPATLHRRSRPPSSRPLGAVAQYTDFENFATLTPGAHQFDALSATLDQVVAWSDALAVLRK